MRDKKFIVHFTSPHCDYELTMPIFAKSLDEAFEWARETLEGDGTEVTRIRPQWSDWSYT